MKTNHSACKRSTYTLQDLVNSAIIWFIISVYADHTIETTSTGRPTLSPALRQQAYQNGSPPTKSDPKNKSYITFF